MPRIIRSRTARQDLREIWDYIAQDDPDAADRFLRHVDAAVRTLSEHPGLGRSRREFRENLRSFPVSSYLIFYKPLADGIFVHRVLHGARFVDILL